MNKKMSKRQRDIKTKLMAAICMLLVSSIMMVSTTYAWFTLSTAPEVTGITTAVGANGNLEMALLPVDGNSKTQDQDYGVTSGTSDSMATQAANLANVTWGNLVDLKNYYGLDRITLYPSALNVIEGTDDSPAKVNTTGILYTPTYGADGRVSAVNPNTVTGVYDTDLTNFYQKMVVDGNVVDDPAGVRVIGTVSGMTEQQLDSRSALSAANTAGGNAQGAARRALEDNGDALGDIAITHVAGDDKYTAADIQSLMNMVNILLGTDSQKGAVSYLEEALRQYIYAYQIATNADYKSLQAEILGTAEAAPTKTLTELKTTYAPTEMTNMIDKLGEMTTELTTAKSELQAQLDATKSEYTWSDISTPMGRLANTEKMSVNGMPVSTTDTDTLKNQIVKDFFAQKGITLTMVTGAGVFADVADFAGNYGATIEIPGSAVGQGLDDTTKVPATMVTETSVNPTYLIQARNTVAAIEIPGASDVTTQPISDCYGYIIDLAFKTNAANSFLQLSTEAQDRIYTDSEDQTSSTMGGGSTMTFTKQDQNFIESDMIELMKHIRIVFFDPSNENAILAYGVLDESVKEVAESVKVGIRLANVPNPQSDADYIDDNQIIALEQNKAQRISVLVYLDGETIRNADVAVGAEKSMVGSLNLQFCSSATLEPMVYTDFEALDGTASGGNTPATPTTAPISTITGLDTTAYAATANYVVSGTSKAIAVVITDAAGTTPVTDAEATVTINGTDATYSNGAWGITYTGTEAPTEVAVVVTAIQNGG